MSVDFSNGFHTHKDISQVEYKLTKTPVVTEISKRFGSPSGGDSLELTGTNFGTVVGDVKVMIDNVECIVQTVAPDSIVCLTG